MKRVLSILGIIVLTLAVFSAKPASALLIPDLFNTGVDDGGLVLPTGTLDTHYTLTGSPAITTINHPAWVVAPADSSWIAPSAWNVTDPAGTYSYSLSFDLTGLDPATASITGNWATDNSAELFLNGISTGYLTPGESFKALSSFNLSSGFQENINTLEFRVENFVQRTGNPTGLLVSGLGGEAEPVVPEPATMVLLGSGLLGMAGFRAKKKL